MRNGLCDSAKMNPVAFIPRRFYQEERYADYHDSPLWRLRRAIYSLKDDDAFSAFMKENPNRRIAWCG